MCFLVEMQQGKDLLKTSVQLNIVKESVNTVSLSMLYPPEKGIFCLATLKSVLIFSLVLFFNCCSVYLSYSCFLKELCNIRTKV